MVWQASICTLDSAHTSASVPGPTSCADGKRVPARVTRQQAARQRELEVCLLQSSQSPSSDDESDDELETFEPDDVDEPAALHLSSRDLASSLDVGPAVLETFATWYAAWLGLGLGLCHRGLEPRTSRRRAGHLATHTVEPCRLLLTRLSLALDSPGNYRREIHAHLRQLEREGAVHHNYMALQRDVTAQMRAILVDWLVEVAQEYAEA